MTRQELKQLVKQVLNEANKPQAAEDAIAQKLKNHMLMMPSVFKAPGITKAHTISVFAYMFKYGPGNSSIYIQINSPGNIKVSITNANNKVLSDKEFTSVEATTKYLNSLAQSIDKLVSSDI